MDQQKNTNCTNIPFNSIYSNREKFLALWFISIEPIMGYHVNPYFTNHRYFLFVVLSNMVRTLLQFDTKINRSTLAENGHIVGTIPLFLHSHKSIWNSTHNLNCRTVTKSVKNKFKFLFTHVKGCKTNHVKHRRLKFYFDILLYQ